VALDFFSVVRQLLLPGKDMGGKNEYFRKYKALNRTCRQDRIVLRSGLELTIDPESRYPFEYFCFRDTSMVQEFDCFLRLMQTRSKLLDIGALHGIFSLAFTQGRSGSHALAIEPSPVAYSRLEFNIRSNPGCCIQALKLALSDHEGELSMYSDWEHVKAVGTSPAPCSNLQIIPAKTGDRVCSMEKFEPDLIKIDVEGYEWQCLVGLKEILRRSQALIFLEIHPEMMKDYGRSPSDLVDILTDQGYTFMNHDMSLLCHEAVRSLKTITRIIVVPEPYLHSPRQ
jgi:FkbM family methyltransferase